MNAPEGAELREGPEYDALREWMDTQVFSHPGAWRRVAGRAGETVFVGRAGDEWYCVAFELVDGEWKSTGMGIGEAMSVSLRDDIVTAEWWLDPAHPPPSEDDTRIRIIVRENECAGISYATGRIMDPLVEGDARSVTVTIAIRPLRGTRYNCSRNPGTPAILDLGQPLGRRQLLDGGVYPPRVPIGP